MRARVASRRRGFWLTAAALLPAAAVIPPVASPITAQAATCIGTPPSGFYHTGFTTCSGSQVVYGYTGLEALISDAGVNLNTGGVHVLEYVDLVMNHSCITYSTCWAQSGWGYGSLPGGSSGPYQRPFYERNDEWSNYSKFFTTVGVNCCTQNNRSNTSTFWDGIVDSNNYGEFQSFFNNEAGSGNVPLGTAYLPGYAVVDLTGEESTNGQAPTVGSVSYAAAQLDTGSWTPWTTSQVGEAYQDTAYYPFSQMSDYQSFTYSGP